MLTKCSCNRLKKHSTVLPFFTGGVGNDKTVLIIFSETSNKERTADKVTAADRKPDATVRKRFYDAPNYRVISNIIFTAALCIIKPHGVIVCFYCGRTLHVVLSYCCYCCHYVRLNRRIKCTHNKRITLKRVLFAYVNTSGMSVPMLSL